METEERVCALMSAHSLFPTLPVSVGLGYGQLLRHFSYFKIYVFKKHWETTVGKSSNTAPAQKLLCTNHLLPPHTEYLEQVQNIS